MSCTALARHSSRSGDIVRLPPLFLPLTGPFHAALHFTSHRLPRSVCPTPFVLVIQYPPF